MSKKPKYGSQLYLPLEGVICNGRKSIKKLLYSLGFHHSWGYYIHNDNHRTRVTIGKGTMDVSMNGCNFNCKDTIIFKGKPIEEVQTRIKRYFGLN